MGRVASVLAGSGCAALIGMGVAANAEQAIPWWWFAIAATGAAIGFGMLLSGKSRGKDGPAVAQAGRDLMAGSIIGQQIVLPPTSPSTGVTSARSPRITDVDRAALGIQMEKGNRICSEARRLGTADPGPLEREAETWTEETRLLVLRLSPELAPEFLRDGGVLPMTYGNNSRKANALANFMNRRLQRLSEITQRLSSS